MYEDKFKQQFPDVNLDISRIWTKDGKFYTSAGVSTGIDLALALVEEDFGSKAALKIAKGLVIFFRRSGSQKQFSGALEGQANESDKFQDLTGWLHEHLHKNLSVDDLAHQIGMSSRNFYRQFKLAFGKSPAEHLRNLRLEKAKELLESGRLDWKKISSRCGMEAEALRRAFIKQNGISPLEYLKRYRP
jgi:transcriptional regulator GlxA family with amidase domain